MQDLNNEQCPQKYFLSLFKGKKMKLEKIHPELRKAIARMPSLPLYNRAFLALVNASFNLFPSKVVGGVQLTIEKVGNNKVRIYRPQGEISGAGLLWIHGGGLILGRAVMDDSLCSTYARDLKLVVVSIDYRLAPKHIFPAAIDDCFAVWQWFQNAAVDLGVDPKRIVISGRSAGGGLAASLAQRIFDTGGIQPCGQALFCPMLDDRTAANQELDAIEHRIWNNKNNRTGWSFYLGKPAGVPDSELKPYAVPARRKNLAGLPQAWIGVGDIDLFFEEDRDYAERLKAAGVLCDFELVPMAPHGFEALVPNAPLSKAFMKSNYQFLTRVLEL